MALFFYLARVAVAGARVWVNDLRRYGELDPDQRHVLWKKAQVAAFLLLMPFFMALGAASRLVGLARGAASRAGRRTPPRPSRKA